MAAKSQWPNTDPSSGNPSARSLCTSEPYAPSFITMIRMFSLWRLMVSSSWTCIIRLPSPSNSTTVPIRARGRHAHGEGDAVADRAELADR